MMMRSHCVSTDTPRSGLVQATEKVIREYIEESCENHLPLIQKLEDVCYNMWVESNTDFLYGSLLEVDIEDEDEYIWDEFMPPSLPCPGTLNEDVCEDIDTRSLDSSISTRDEWDCRRVYRDGSEDKLNPDSPQPERVYNTNTAECKLLINQEIAFNEVNKFGPEQSKNQHGRQISKFDLESNGVTEHESEINIPHDWVIVNSDISEECFSEQKPTRLQPKGVDIYSERTLGSGEVLNDDCRLGSEEYCTDQPDIETWSVLTMIITEYDYPNTRRRLFGVV